MKKMAKRVAISFIAIIALAVCITAFQEKEQNLSVMPQISSSESSIGFDKTLELSNENGENLVFAVENIGEYDVELFINDSEPVIVAVGQEGSITESIDSKNEKFELRVRAVMHGGITNIEFNIYQE